MRGSSRRATTVWAILSATVGTPKILVPPPCGFGISTARTGGGNYLPEDIRFQTLYRLFFRSASKSSTEHPSTPGAPLLALTFSHACQTSAFEISNGLPDDFSSLTRLLPGSAPRFRCQPFLFRHFIGSDARLPDPYLTHPSAPFPTRSPRQASTNAAVGGLEPPPAGRFRRAHLHRPHSTRSRSSTYIKLPSRSGRT